MFPSLLSDFVCLSILSRFTCLLDHIPVTIRYQVTSPRMKSKRRETYLLQLVFLNSASLCLLNDCLPETQVAETWGGEFRRQLDHILFHEHVDEVASLRWGGTVTAKRHNRPTLVFFLLSCKPAVSFMN